MDASASLGPLVITGNLAANAITGTSYADTITGGAGADALNGGAGNDVFLVALATDMGTTEVLNGGTGVDVLRFPLELGKTWQVSSTGTGFVNFTPLSTSNTYRFLVDGRGDVWTPAARFPSLRLRMDLEQTIPLTLFRRTVRAFVFLSECWGTVARVTGVDNDTSTELTRASEWRRLAP